MLLVYLSMVETDEEQTTIEYICKKYNPLMKSIALSIMKNSDLAEDVVQDAMIRIIEWVRTKHPDVKTDNIKGVVTAITRNVALDSYRKERRYDICSMDEEGVIEPSAWDKYSTLETRDYHTVLNTLSREYIQILQLNIQHQLSPKQISKVLGISYENARKRLHRAQKAFAAEWRKQNADK